MPEGKQPSRLLQALRDDPDAIFEIKAKLPSGNQMMGTVGPMINGKICSSITFSNSDASEDDINLATEALNQALGLSCEASYISRTPEEVREAAKKTRQFLGGGVG